MVSTVSRVLAKVTRVVATVTRVVTKVTRVVAKEVPSGLWLTLITLYGSPDHFVSKWYNMEKEFIYTSI